MTDSPSSPMRGWSHLSGMQQPEHSSTLFLDLSAVLLRCGHSVRFHAEGQSMQPTIRAGEAITVAPVMPAQIKRGDIVLYRSARRVTAHRVVRIKRNKRSTQSSVLSPQSSFILRGDASNTYDEPVGAEQVLGRVVAVERAGRRIALGRRRATVWGQGRMCASRLKQWMSRLRRPGGFLSTWT